MSSPFRVIALMAAYNEADIVAQSVAHLVGQGIDVYFIDDGSTDHTVRLLQPFLGQGLIAIERMEPPTSSDGRFHWRNILRRKEELARELTANWFIHHDVDEFRESPWPGVSLRESIQAIDRLGYNTVAFEVFTFPPVDERFEVGDDIESAFPFFEPAEEYDRYRLNGWKSQAVDVDLATEAGHAVRFDGRHVFPVRFIIRHYPVRSQAHGERKVFAERLPRFLPNERAEGWHIQYDRLSKGHSFIRDPASLTRFDLEQVRLRLLLNHQGVEALRAELVASQKSAGILRTQALEAAQDAGHLRAQLDQAHEDIKARSAELERLRDDGRQHADRAAISERELLEARQENETLLQQRRMLQARVDDLLHSVSWRATAPLRRLLDAIRSVGRRQ